VLDAVARALHLDQAETEHLHTLARAAGPAIRRPRPNPDATLRPSLQRFLDAITCAPAWIADQRTDIIALNPLGRALMAPMLDDPVSRNNIARFIFFSPVSTAFYPDWEQGADNVVASLRIAAGQNPHDKDLTGLIGELVTRSDAFRVRWSAHNVRHHRTGTKRIRHPEVGELEFTFGHGAAGQSGMGDVRLHHGYRLTDRGTRPAPGQPRRHPRRRRHRERADTHQLAKGVGLSWRLKRASPPVRARPNGSPATWGSTRSRSRCRTG
jgi:hypothetical protein